MFGVKTFGFGLRDGVNSGVYDAKSVLLDQGENLADLIFL